MNNTTNSQDDSQMYNDNQLVEPGEYFVWILLIGANVLVIACQLIWWLITRNQNPPNNVNPRQREDLPPSYNQTLANEQPPPTYNEYILYFVR